MSASASDDLTPGSDQHWEAVHTGLAADHLIALGQVAYWSARTDTTLPLLAAAAGRPSRTSATEHTSALSAPSRTAWLDR